MKQSNKDICKCGHKREDHWKGMGYCYHLKDCPCKYFDLKLKFMGNNNDNNH